MTFHYVWLVWSSAFLLPRVLLYALFPRHRVAMWWASVFMALFGLTDPIFVPAYWNPPSLFELAQRTGFDIESLIFSFAIGASAPSCTTRSQGSVSFRSAPAKDISSSIGFTWRPCSCHMSCSCHSIFCPGIQSTRHL